MAAAQEELGDAKTRDADLRHELYGIIRKECSTALLSELQASIRTQCVVRALPKHHAHRHHAQAHARPA